MTAVHSPEINVLFSYLNMKKFHVIPKLTKLPQTSSEIFRSKNQLVLYKYSEKSIFIMQGRLHTLVRNVRLLCSKCFSENQR